MNDKILSFLKKQTAASICCVNEINEPYCFSCFYAFNSYENLLYFKSAPTAYHSKILLKNAAISGTIMPDKLNILALKGIQFEGVALAENNPLCADAFKKYHSRFPQAFAISGVVYTIRLNSIKMTDNLPGIFKKHAWQREQEATIQSP
ncbi:MAG: hypothetical protein ABI091_30525 [Ferruginibacter sp.]